MRMSFFRGVVTGSMLGAAVSLLLAPAKKDENTGFIGAQRPRNRSQTRGVLKNVSKTVNEVGKSFNDYIKN
ncbi:MAG: hypothetical protein FH756_03410 [Firmicutes bacterium]|nr:hypothetical protein [Bacillota bacterium]